MANNELLRPAEVEFSQFTAVLIAETLDAVIAAQLDQEEKVRGLQELAGLDPARFAEEVVSGEEVEEELARLFPAAERTHGVMPGSPYVPAAPGKEEDPPVEQVTGYIMKDEDWTRTDEGAVITEAGYKHILSHVRMSLATQQLANILQLVRRGIPRVIVDHGRVNTKLTFQLSRTRKSGNAGRVNVRGMGELRAARLTRSGTPVMQLSRPVVPFRLTVRPADLRRPELLRLSVNVVGEVEITFKTVSD